MNRLRVATFNIRNSRGVDGRHVWPLRRRTTLAVIEALDADVVALQEVRPGQLRWLARRLADDYEVRAVGRDDGHRGEHLVVLARRSAVRVDRVEARWFTDTPTAPGRHPRARRNRCALIVSLTAGTTSVTVATTHLDEHSPAARRDAAERLARWLPGTAVLLGDFNGTIDDPAWDPLFAAGFVDALAGTAADGPGCATHHGFSGRTDGTRIDHVLVPSTVTVTAARIVHEQPPGPWASDHWPVIADLDLR